MTRTDHRRQLRHRDRVADPGAGEPERLGERAKNDRTVLHALECVNAGVVGVGLVDNELSRHVGDIGQLSGWIVRATHEDEISLRRVIDQRGPGHQRGVAVHRIRNCGHRGDRAAFGEDSRAQDDELVATSAQSNLIEPEAVVGGNGLTQRLVASPVVLVDIGQRARECGGTSAHRGCRCDVAVESDDGPRVESDSRANRLVRRRPLVGVECGGCRHRRAVARCMGMPSSSASASIVGARRSRPSLVTR